MINILELNWYHHEVFGSFINFFNNNNKQFTFFYNDTPLGYTEYYNSIFKEYNNTPQSMKLTNNDKLIINTSDLYSRLDKNLMNKLQNNIYYIAHHCSPQSINTTLMKNIITLSPIVTKNIIDTYGKDQFNITELFPIYNLPLVRYIPVNQRNNRILILGSMDYDNRDFTFIKDFVDKYNGDIIHICYGMLNKLKEFIPDKITYISGFSTDKLVKAICHSKAILILSKKGGNHYKSQLCGALPLSITCNTPLIIEETLASIYGLDKCVITFKKSAVEILEQLEDISDVTTEIKAFREQCIKSNEYKLSKIF